MACKGKSGTSLPCQQLAAAQQQLLLLMSGRATVSVETPQLGRVQFSQGSVADLQRLIDGLTAQCAESQGLQSARRRPISIESWP
jgi:gpW